MFHRNHKHASEQIYSRPTDRKDPVYVTMSYGNGNVVMVPWGKR